LNVAVSCGGVAVLPGDIVVGDDDGVVIVPSARGKEVVDEATTRQALEQEWHRRLDAGETTLALLGIKPV
jgi:4-hydroxy-4-methyl-2-oxoglutarate aldolase